MSDVAVCGRVVWMVYREPGREYEVQINVFISIDRIVSHYYCCLNWRYRHHPHDSL